MIATARFQVGDRVRVDGHEDTGVVVEVKTHVNRHIPGGGAPWIRVLFDRNQPDGYSDSWLAEAQLHVA